MGDTSGCIEGGMGREATDTELSGAVICDGRGVTSGAITGLDSGINLVFGGGGIVPAALLAIVLNVLIPKGKDDTAAEEAAAHLEALKAQKLAEKE